MWIVCRNKNRFTTPSRQLLENPGIGFTMKHFVRTATLVCAPILAQFPAAALADVYTTGSSSATFNVTFNVQANCLIAVKSLNFGSSSGLSLAINDESTLNVTCTNKTPYNVGLDAGNVPTSTVSNRLLAGASPGNAAASVTFQLYQDAGRQVVWGNTQGTDMQSGTGDGSTQSYTMFGQVPAQSMAIPGDYQSVVTATVNF
jgi:spore coat protein U-like protein